MFQHTYCDFVAHLTLPESDGGTPDNPYGTVVVGEYKVLMEHTNPRNRVTDRQNMMQVVANARLFQLMTGVSPAYGAVFYLTRRGPLAVPASAEGLAYVVVFPLRRTGVEAFKFAFDRGDPKPREFFKMCNEWVVSPLGGKSAWTLYADRRHMACVEGSLRDAAPAAATGGGAQDTSWWERFRREPACATWTAWNTLATGDGDSDDEPESGDESEDSDDDDPGDPEPADGDANALETLSTPPIPPGGQFVRCEVSCENMVAFRAAGPDGQWRGRTAAGRHRGDGSSGTDSDAPAFLGRMFVAPGCELFV